MKRGFTLIELIIALALSAVIMVVTFPGFFQIVRSWERWSAATQKTELAMIVMTRIVNDLRQADQVEGSGCPDKIALVIDGVAVSYDWHDGKVRRIKSGSSAYLTDTNQTDKLQFSYDDGSIQVRLGERAMIVTSRRGR